MAEQATLSASYLVFMATAGVLAAVALLTNSVPVLVGSMVVAPALAPLALISFALVGRKPRLALRGLGVALGKRLEAAARQAGGLMVEMPSLAAR